MIILRIKSKLFSWYRKRKPRRDPAPPRFPIPAGLEHYPRSVLMIYSNRYSNEMRQMGPRREYVKLALKEVKEGFYDTDDPANVAKGLVFDTHILLDFSKLKRYRRFTKSINNFDRVDYLVYPPKLIRGIVCTPIVVTSCIGHEIAGLRSYTEIDNDEETKVQEL